MQFKGIQSFTGTPPQYTSLPQIVPTRFTIGVMMFTACMLSYMLRVNMSINILDMVKHNASTMGSSGTECAVKEFKNDSKIEDTIHAERFLDSTEDDGKYHWSASVQGIILGAYFWGYMVTSLPGGPMAERWGPRKVIGISSGLAGLLTMLSPLAASIHHGALTACRFFIGLLGGVLYPSLHCLVANWAPPDEKGKFIGALMGGTFGTVITWSICGVLISTLGWQWAFYIPGVIVIVWSVIWFFLVSDTPHDHPRITLREKNYILDKIGESVQKDKPTVPINKILLSIPFWAFTVLHFGNLWGLYFLLTAGPKFISQVLGFNLAQAGVLSGLPYITRMVMGFFFGAIGDILRKKSNISVTLLRKMFCIFSHIIPGVLLVCITYIGCNSTLSIVIITASLGINGAATLTNLQNHQDLAPNYAGTLYGMANCIGSATGFITPLITSYFTKEHNGFAEWRNIFMCGAAAYFISAVVFIIFGSGETQSWNKKSQDVKVLQKEEQTGDVRAIDNPGFEMDTTKAV